MILKKEHFLEKYDIKEEYLRENNISWNNLVEIYNDYNIYRKSYETQAELIAHILRSHKKVHSVKTRVKDGEHLIEKIIRKTENRRKKYGEGFNFTIEEDWEEIHHFISSMWKVNEIVANIREGDNTKTFEELGIEVCSRLSGYRSVHYLVESYPTSQKVISEIQVRTIFEEGYGEVDHQLRYSLRGIPEVLEQNLMLLNRIAGSSDEMASLINMLSKSFKNIEKEYKEKLSIKDQKILNLRENILSSTSISENDKKCFIKDIDNIIR